MNKSPSAFWHFSLRLYRRPEVPAVCIDLQDQHGLDVNLLFFIVFLAINQRRVTADDIRRIDAYIRDWRARVVQPLRALRRDLKGGITPVDANATEALRSAIKRDELQAERLQQETMERAFPVLSIGVMAEPRAAALENLNAHGAVFGALPQAAIDTLLSALTAEFLV